MHNQRAKESYKSNPDITKDYREEYNKRQENIRADRKKSFYQMVNDSKSVVADEMIFTSDKTFLIS